MNIQLKDVDNVVFNSIDISAVKFNDVLVWQKWETIEYTGGVPVTVTANGEPLLDWLVKGNMQQSGTPTPTSPIQPEECGERTGNLLDYAIVADGKGISNDGTIIDQSTRCATTTAIDITNIDSAVLSYKSTNAISFIYAVLNNGVLVRRVGANTTGATLDLSGGNELYLCWYYLGTVVKTDISNVMLNPGSTALPYEPYGYKLDISSGGENLFDKSNDALLYNSTNLATSGKWSYGSTGVVIRIPCEADTGYTLSCNIDTSVWRISTCSLDDIPTSVTEVDVVDIQRGKPTSGVRTFTTNSVAKYILFQVGSSSIEQARAALMLNLGSTAEPYTPYNRTTTPIYLGEVPTTRRIKKLVLTGEETWWTSGTYTGAVYAYHSQFPGIKPLTEIFCTHLVDAQVSSYAQGTCKNDLNSVGMWVFDTATSPTAFKAWLAAQYANGTPVTVWYVLANEQTGILNEPIRKIGDYADTVSMEQAGVQIPTISGINVVDIDTTLKPSSIYLKYKGKT